MATKKHEDAGMDKSMMQKAVNKHEKAQHPGKPLTKLAKGGITTRGNGAATKGTKAYGPMA
jgi:hypothetical protein